jgi:hypothetical protein
MSKTRGSVVGRSADLQAGRPHVLVPMCSLQFYNLPNAFSRIVVLGLTQVLT